MALRKSKAPDAAALFHAATEGIIKATEDLAKARDLFAEKAEAHRVTADLHVRRASGLEQQAQDSDELFSAVSGVFTP